MTAPTRNKRSQTRAMSHDVRLSLISIWAPLLSVLLLVLLFGGQHMRTVLCHNILAPVLGVSQHACR